MPDPAQKVSPKGIRILAVFVVAYLAGGFYLWSIELPGLVYAGYGILAWVLGMMLFYRLHKSYMADLGEEIQYK